MLRVLLAVNSVRQENGCGSFLIDTVLSAASARLASMGSMSRISPKGDKSERSPERKRQFSPERPAGDMKQWTSPGAAALAAATGANPLLMMSKKFAPPVRKDSQD